MPLSTCGSSLHFECQASISPTPQVWYLECRKWVFPNFLAVQRGHCRENCKGPVDDLVWLGAYIFQFFHFHLRSIHMCPCFSLATLAHDTSFWGVAPTTETLWRHCCGTVCLRDGSYETGSGVLLPGGCVPFAGRGLRPEVWVPFHSLRTRSCVLGLGRWVEVVSSRGLDRKLPHYVSTPDPLSPEPETWRVRRGVP